MMRDKQDFRHIAALDGVRGLAVILVFVSHAAATQAPFATTQSRLGAWLHQIAMRGWVGVDLFFVLSGFLITGILLRAREAENYYQVFYARRALRIFPLYYLVMFGSMSMSMHWPPIKAQVWFWFNLSNFPTAFNPSLITYLTHYWSLAIEEQFYLVWPTMVRRLNEKILIRICLGAFVGCFVLRNLPIVLAWNERWPNFVYRFTLFRVDTLCAGALLAILTHRCMRMRKCRSYLRIGFIAGVAILAITLFAGTHYDLPARLGYTGAALCFTTLIALALDPASSTAKIFRNGFLQRMGLYSYCFYLIHVGVISHERILSCGLTRLHLAFANAEMSRMVVHCIAFAVTFGICAVSYKFFEAPILRLKRFFPYRDPRLSKLAVATVS